MAGKSMAALLALGLFLGFTHAALADSYKLVNNTGHPLKVQSKALKFTQPAQAKPEFFEMAKGESKKVDFGNDFRLWFLHIYNKDDMSQNHYWDRKPKPTDPNQSWKLVITIKDDKMAVDSTQP